MGDSQEGGAKGKKRWQSPICRYTLGLVIEALVHSAGIQDRDGARYLVSKAKTNGATFQKGYVDGADTGGFIDWAQVTWDVSMEVVKRSDRKNLWCYRNDGVITHGKFRSISQRIFSKT